MQNEALTRLMGELARLLSPRSSTDRARALGIAHNKLRNYAEVHRLSEEWCDAVMLLFFESSQRRFLAA